MSTAEDQRKLLIDAILKLQTTAVSYEEKSKKLYDEQIVPKHTELKQLDEAHKTKMSHIETVTMMSKYQFVFLQLDRCLRLWSKAIQRQIDPKLRLQHAFNSFKQNSLVFRDSKRYTRHLLVRAVQSKLVKIDTSLKARKTVLLQQSLHKWSLAAKSINQVEREEANLKEVQTDMQKEETAIKMISIEHQNNQVEYSQIEQELRKEQTKAEKVQREIEKAKKEKEIRKQKEKEQTEEVPQPEVNLESDPILDEDISRLQSKIDRLKEDNNSLKLKISNTNSGISSYISEMSTLLESEEFLQSIDLDMPLTAENETPTLNSQINVYRDENQINSSNNINPSIDNDDLPNTGNNQPYSSTGGSSKMRPRPYRNIS